MSEFDPSEPVLVHDRRSNRILPWSPAFRRSYERTAHELAPGVVDYDGLLLDGWMIVEDDLARARPHVSWFARRPIVGVLAKPFALPS